jgi:spermidine/putrescine-binding protein
MNRAAHVALSALVVLAPGGCETAPRKEAIEASKPAVAPAAPGKELNLFAWSEYVPQPVIDGFTRETGIQVNYEAYASNEEMLAKLVSGAERYDLVQPSEYTVEALVKEDRLLPIDWSKVPNIRNIGREYRNLPHDPDQKYTVPWMAGTVGIVVNTEKIRQPVRGYADVFRREHDGRIVILDDPREIVSWALAVKGRRPNDVTPGTLAEIRPLLEQWLPLVKVYDSDSPKTALLGGDVDLGVVWSGEAALLYKEDPKFAYVLPAEGTHQFLDSLAIPRNAANPAGAMMFMDYILRPEVSRLISADFPYTNPNVEARRLLTPEELGNPASYPKGSPKLDGFSDLGSRAADIDKLVTDLKAGA